MVEVGLRCEKKEAVAAKEQILEVVDRSSVFLELENLKDRD